MATYKDIRSLFNDGDLVNRAAVAVVVSVSALLDGTPTAADRAYAAGVFSNPQSEAKKALMYVLASNKSATVAAIKAATDAALQTKVDAVVPVLIKALAGV